MKMNRNRRIKNSEIPVARTNIFHAYPGEDQSQEPGQQFFRPEYHIALCNLQSDSATGRYGFLLTALQNDF